MMKAILVNGDKLEVGQAPRPQIESDEVIIKVEAFGCNRADLLQREGKYPPPPGASEILGLEVCGSVSEAGDDVPSELLGSRVACMLSGGGYAEYAAAKVDQLIPVPEEFTTVDFAAVPEVFLTAFQAIYSLAKAQQGERILIHAGASGVGTAAIQIAKALNLEVAVTCSTSEKAEFCLSLGADIAITHRSQDFEDELKLLKFFPNIVIDVVAGDYLNKNINICNLDGRIVQLAMMAGRFSDQLDMAKVLGKRLNLMGSTLRNRSDEYKAHLTSQFKEALLPLFSEGKLRPIVDKVYSADYSEFAHQCMKSNLNMGKLIITW